MKFGPEDRCKEKKILKGMKSWNLVILICRIFESPPPKKKNISPPPLPPPPPEFLIRTVLHQDSTFFLPNNTAAKVYTISYIKPYTKNPVKLKFNSYLEGLLSGLIQKRNVFEIQSSFKLESEYQEKWQTSGRIRSLYIKYSTET